MQLQNYRLPKGMNNYPVALIWYPREEFDRWSIRSSSYAYEYDSIIPPPGPNEEWLRNFRQKSPDT